MSGGRLSLPADSAVPALARAFATAGGRLLVVGGFVRDALRGVVGHDLDLEAFGLAEDAIDRLVADFGFSPRVGRQLPVWRRTRDGLDLAFPRAGAFDYRREQPESIGPAFREAARHRDLTVNAMAWDPLAEVLVDPWNGASDLRARRLVAVDLETFGADPLRLLRVARLHAVLGASVDPALEQRCRSLSLADVPNERIAGELVRILLDPVRPSVAFAWLAAIGRLDVFPEVQALLGVPQDPVWHPEGDVFVHTLLVLDRARAIAGEYGGDRRRALVLMLAALAHDFGKPVRTQRDGERVRSHGHESESARCARRFVGRLRLAESLGEAVAALVEHHLAPVALVRQQSSARAYRRLARRLAEGGCSLADLERLTRADQLGRTTPDALANRFDAGPAFLTAAAAAEVRDGVRPDVVRARDLIARGIAPGPELGRLLARCREIEDETGWRDSERIVRRCLAEAGRGGRGDEVGPSGG